MSEDSEPEEGVDARGALVFRENRTNVFYKVGTIACSAVGETSAIICIAELGGRLIVAVPGAVWTKKVAKRKLEKSTLGKALGVDVVACSEADLENPLPEVSIKARVGILSMNDEAKVEFVTTPPTYDFGTGVLPYAEALVRVADERFDFATAESGGGGDGIFKRMSLVESGLADTREMLKTLVCQTGEAAPSTATGARPKAGLRTGKARAGGGATQTAGDLGALDRSTVAAARAAGISDESLKEMSRLIGAKRNKVEEIPVPEALGEDDGAGIDGELDEEAANLEDFAQGPHGDGRRSLDEEQEERPGLGVPPGPDPWQQLDRRQRIWRESTQPCSGVESSDKGFQRKPQSHIRVYRGPDGERFHPHPGGAQHRCLLGQGLVMQQIQDRELPESRKMVLASGWNPGRPCNWSPRACESTSVLAPGSGRSGQYRRGKLGDVFVSGVFKAFSPVSCGEPGDGSVRPQVGRDLPGHSQGARELQRGKEKASSSRPEPRFWPTPESERSTWRQAPQRKGQRRQERQRWFGAKVRQVGGWRQGRGHDLATLLVDKSLFS